MLGHPIEEMADLREIPEQFSVVMMAFYELNAGRSFNFAGPNPIAYTEIQAWCALSGVDLGPWHVRAVKQLDGLWMTAHARPATNRPPKS